MTLIRPSVTTNFAPLDRLLRLTDAYAEEVAEVAYDESVAEDPAMRRALSQTPPKFTGKRDWQSDRQHKAYHASDGFGRGIPSVRTGRMNDAYELLFNVERGAISVSLVNTSGYYRFVVGGLRKDAPPTQQRLHVQGGYKPVAPIIDDRATAFRVRVVKAIHRIPSNFR